MKRPVNEQESDGPMVRAAGGRARLEAILILGGVLALDGADKGTIGAIAEPLKAALAIDNTQLGLLVTASTAVGALATLPIGALVDRYRRTYLLGAAIMVWSLAMIVGGCVSSYGWLLISRLALGAVVGTAAPAVASLTGDLFSAGERGRIWGYLLGGELLGSAIGLAVSGVLAGAVSWRAPFWLLGALGLVLAVLLVWRLREPARGGQAGLPAAPAHTTDHATDHAQAAAEQTDISEAIDQSDIRGQDRPRQDPGLMSFFQVAVYVLSIRSNLVLIIASALGYFFFTGLRTFALVFMGSRFDLGQSVATLVTISLGLGSFVGVMISGRLADRLIRRGYPAARMVVPAIAFFLCTAFIIPGLVTTSLLLTAPVFFLSAMSLGATNPPLDAARLDVLPSQVWGRAEAIRAALRNVFEAAAPLAFGYMSTLLGQGVVQAIGARPDQNTDGTGLARTLGVMSFVLVIAGVILLRNRRAYPQDVAAALEAQRAADARAEQ